MASQRPRIGQIFLAKKLITQLELNTALQHQERFGGRIGSILAKLSYISEADLVQILSEIYRIPIVHLDSSRAQVEALNLVPVAIAKKHHLLPLRVERSAGGRRVLHVAIDEPQNASAIDEVRFLTEISNIQTYLAPPTALEKAISLYYDRPQLAAATGGTGVPLPETREEMVIIRSQADEQVQLDGDEGVTGRLADMGLTDLVQVLGAGGKTVQVQITSRGVVGDMYLDDGQIVHAECGALKGERAFFEMLGWSEGNFTILPRGRPSARTIQVSNDGLILEGLRQMDERGEHTTLEDGISSEPPAQGGLAVDTIQVESRGDLGANSTAAPPPGLESTGMPTEPPTAVLTGGAATPGARADLSIEQMKRLLRLLVKKGVLTEAEARFVFSGRR